MNINDFLRLVPIFKFDLSPRSEGFRYYVPLNDLLDAVGRNRLQIITESELQKEYFRGAIESAKQAELNAQVKPHSCKETVNK